LKKSLLNKLIFSFLLTGCVEGDKRPNENVQNINENLEIIAEQLRVPWSIDSDGTSFFISERAGSIVKVTESETIRQKLHPKKRLATASEAGVLGFVLHPEKEHYGFLYYTYEDESGQFNRVVELRKEKNEWYEENVLIDHIPSGTYHHGGRMKIGPDNKMYIATGDATVPSIAQDKTSLAGEILRINLDGTIPHDNPNSNSLVYSYGHRNPQGLSWDQSGQLYSSEHGPSAHDELNVVKANGNYGWPQVYGNESKEGMIPPIIHSGEQTWAPSGMAYHNGILYVAQLRGEGVLAFDIKEKITKQIVSNVGRVRDVFIHGDYLYIITNNTDGRGNPNDRDDKLMRVQLSKIDR